jgi:hypothetical protein
VIPADRKNVQVHLSPDLRADLDILMRNGRGSTDVIRAAVRLYADAHLSAWEAGDVPPDADPRVTYAAYAGMALPCGHQVGGSGA